MPIIRTASPADAPALLEIYRPYIEHCAVSFETEVPSVDDFAIRMDKALKRWTWLVAEENGKCIGYAYGSAHRERAAYRWSVETSAYIHADHQRKGVGRLLYEELFQRLESLGYCNAFAGITLPNEASLGLHRRLGFEAVGIFKRVGWKFGQWHDVAWFQRKIREIPRPE